MRWCNVQQYGQIPSWKNGRMKIKMRALSIRQPYAEQILRGQKKIEFDMGFARCARTDDNRLVLMSVWVKINI
jgi:hypothetical protein